MTEMDHYLSLGASSQYSLAIIDTFLADFLVVDFSIQVLLLLSLELLVESLLGFLGLGGSWHLGVLTSSWSTCLYKFWFSLWSLVVSLVSNRSTFYSLDSLDLSSATLVFSRVA